MGRPMRAWPIFAQSVDVQALEMDGLILIPATDWIWASANPIDPTRIHSANGTLTATTRPMFSISVSVLPASGGNRGQGLGNQRQPFGVFVQFTPATYVCIPRQKKKDRSMELIDPISSCGNDALVGVDMHNRTGRHHGVQGAVVLANDAPPKPRRRDPIICRKNSGMIRRPNSTGRIRNGKFAKIRGVGTTWRNEA
jgi:hypothetical protein